jgi:hypothetical protein
MNLSAVVEVNVWDRMRNSRRQSPPFTWFFRLLGVGYLVWVIALDLLIPTSCSRCWPASRLSCAAQSCI